MAPSENPIIFKPFRKHAHAIYSNISRLKNVHFQMIFFFLIFFLFLLKTLTVGTNEYLQSMFQSKNKKIMYTPVNPTFTIQKWDARGYKPHRRVILMENLYIAVWENKLFFRLNRYLHDCFREYYYIKGSVHGRLRENYLDSIFDMEWRKQMYTKYQFRIWDELGPNKADMKSISWIEIKM